MRKCDRAAILAGTPETELIFRAASALSESALRLSEGLPVLFFCGKGNNGADGKKAAELLASRGADARAIEAFVPLPALPEAYLAVDCVFGTGFHGRVPEALKSVFSAISRGKKVLACDIPSGLNADNGIADPMTVPAHATVTFAACKYGQLLKSGKDFCGELTLADIGIPVVTEYAERVDGRSVATLFPPRKNDCHKGSFEKVYLIGGSAEFRGAPVLSARAEAALRSGCGYATLVCPKNTGGFLCPEHTYRFCGEDHLSFDESVLREAAGADVAVLGMGMGQSEACAEIERYLIANARRLVVDADGLNLLAKHPEWRELPRKGELFLTPHPAEFARLCGTDTREVLENPVALADEFARETGTNLLLKGTSSYITDGTRRYVNATGSPALAKAGSGDALNGFLAVPVARGGLFGLAAGSFLHGACAILAAQEGSVHAVLASDLPAFLPRVLHGIGV